MANRAGRPADDEAAAILATARRHGIRTIDTAIAYGDAERRLGHHGVGDWDVITKLPPRPAEAVDGESWVRRGIEGSLERLGVPMLYGVLLHRPADLSASDGARLHAGLVAAKVAGLVKKIGVSVYGPTELDATVPRFELDLVQAPLNVIDRRIIESGWLAKLHAQGVEVHARSAFLQGLLLMSSETRPPHFARWATLWSKWEAWVARTGRDATAASLSFVMAQSEIAKVVVGVDNARQLDEIVAASQVGAPEPPSDLSCADEALVNPALWQRA